MKVELLDIQKNLDCIFNEEVIDSEFVLSLSKELDKVIMEYYKALAV